jgi:uncharacterized alpha-E superfamily protein
MLSRAAERIYWLGRYLERAENTARIVQQHSQLLLDLPEETGVRWTELIRIFGAADAYAGSGLSEGRGDILSFLLVESGSASSLSNSLRMARENTRNSRDLLPQEAWECINELHYDMREQLPLAARGDSFFETLAECIGRCQQVNGVLDGTMSHRAPYQFLMLGQAIERADMTSRIIDVAATAYMVQDEKLVRRYGSTLWTSVLKSVSGFQMYRQYCDPHVEDWRVISFLLCDRTFPRAIACCRDRGKQAAASLPRGEAASNALDDISPLLTPIGSGELLPKGVSQLMDELQKRLAHTHTQVVDTWFIPDPD